MNKEELTRPFRSFVVRFHSVLGPAALRADGRRLRCWCLGLGLLVILAAPPRTLADSVQLAGFSPSTGIPEVTRVYIYGTFFEDTQGTGSVKIGGVQATVVLWTDYLIEVVAPFGAQETGTVEVDSQDNGSDSSSDWGGTFTTLQPNYPPFYDPSQGINVMDPAGPAVPQYVEGTWNYSSCETSGSYCAYEQYVLSQGGQNSDGSYSISGSMNWWDNAGSTGCSDSITGTLSSGGVLTINPSVDEACQYWGEAWVVSNSGDTTSWGYIWYPWPSLCPSPAANFPSGEGLYYGYPCALWDTQLYKDSTDTPSTETPTFVSWAAFEPTQGGWQRTLPTASDGLTEFSGRFVFEQVAPGGGANDGCYQSAIALWGQSPYARFTGPTGGGWFVNSNGVWGSSYPDYIGFFSGAVDWYQQNVGQCSAVLYQAMFIDSVNGAVAYNAGGPNGSTNQLEMDIFTVAVPGVCSDVTPSGGNQVIKCEDYPAN